MTIMTIVRYLCTLIGLFGVTWGRIENNMVANSHEDSENHNDLEVSAGDNLLDDIVESPFRNAIRDKSRRFPNGVVPYVIDPSFGDIKIAKIKEMMSLIQNYTRSGTTYCIKFRPKRDTDISYFNIIKVSPNEQCNAEVGINYARGTLIRLTDKCASVDRPRFIVHEIMHSLGFYHEHTRTDRDNYITVLWQSQPVRSRTYWYQIRRGTTNQSIPYDYGSRLHYPNGISVKRDNYIGGRRKALGLLMSKYDVLRIQRFYSCPEDNTEYRKVSTDKLLVDCSFENGLCNLTQERYKDNFDWTRGKYPADRPSDRGYYLYAEAKNHQGQVAILKTNRMEPGCYRISVAFYKDSFRDGNTLRLDIWYPLNGFLTPFETIQYKSGDRWSLQTDSRDIPFTWYLSIEAHIGGGSKRDVAIDDVLIKKC